MKKILLFSVLLVLGIVSSQLLPLLGKELYFPLKFMIKFLTMLFLGFVMIHVGLEFFIKKRPWQAYAWDYFVATTTATFPWFFCALYFMLFLSQSSSWADATLWKESLLVARFAAPTSAGVLFAMLLSLDLGQTWLFRKSRILAIFDDLDTILLMIPLHIAIVGLKWELSIVIFVIFSLLYILFKYFRSFDLPVRWKWVLLYSLIITGISDAIHLITRLDENLVPIHLEVLLPAFVMGAIIKHHKNDAGENLTLSQLHCPKEIRAYSFISGCFMTLVGLSTPAFIGVSFGQDILPSWQDMLAVFTWEYEPFEAISWKEFAKHLFWITLIMSVGKLFPAFCYRNEVGYRQRIALVLGMCIRGEVAAAVLVTALNLGVKGPMVLLSIMSLAINLCMTGLMMVIIKLLINGEVRTSCSL